MYLALEKLHVQISSCKAILTILQRRKGSNQEETSHKETESSAVEGGFG